MEKLCKKCNLSKEIDNFHKDKRGEEGFSRWCKDCKKEYDNLYRKSSKIRELYSSKEYRDRKLEYRKYRATRSIAEKLWYAAKIRARQQNLPFDIEVQDIIVPEFCPLLEIPIYQKPYGKGGFHMNSPSLDKVIPEKGYTKDNIMVLSMKANAMKYSATIDELKTFSKNILNKFKDD